MYTVIEDTVSGNWSSGMPIARTRRPGTGLRLTSSARSGSGSSPRLMIYVEVAVVGVHSPGGREHPVSVDGAGNRHSGNIPAVTYGVRDRYESEFVPLRRHAFHFVFMRNAVGCQSEIERRAAMQGFVIVVFRQSFRDVKSGQFIYGICGCGCTDPEGNAGFSVPHRDSLRRVRLFGTGRHQRQRCGYG